VVVLLAHTIFVSIRVNFPIISLFLTGVFQDYIIINAEFEGGSGLKTLAKVAILAVFKLDVAIGVEEDGISQIEFYDCVGEVSLESFDTVVGQSPGLAESVLIVRFACGLAAIDHVVNLAGPLHS